MEFIHKHLIFIFIFTSTILSSPSAASSTCGKLYEVQPGETCSSISRASGKTLREFLLINPVINCTNLLPGEQVCITPCLKKPIATPSRKPRRVLIDYIGAVDPLITFSKVHIAAEELEHIFILSFAIDANRSGVVQNGRFIRYWSDSLTPESILELRSRHPNVKVLLSLAGYSLDLEDNKGTQIVQWYDPSDVHLWINNAIESIGSLVREYYLDGVDIDYESMNSSDSKFFPFCIGEVIKALKRNRVISVATVAPYGESAPYYQRLLREYGGEFDYINFQFYSFGDVRNASAYVQLYREIAPGFDRKKLLLSLEVDGKVKSRGVSGAEFFKAVEELSREVEIPGIFLWSAEGSMENGFLVEKVAECIL